MGIGTPEDGGAGRADAKTARARMERFGGCSKCMVPQAYCGRWAEVVGDGGQFRLRKWGDCDDTMLLFRVVAGFEHQAPRLFRRVFEEWMGDEQWDGEVDGEVVWRWMGKRVRIGRVETNRLCMLFLRLVDIWQEEMDI